MIPDCCIRVSCQTICGFSLLCGNVIQRHNHRVGSTSLVYIVKRQVSIYPESVSKFIGIKKRENNIRPN
jgi:hypothetical protein